MSPSVYVSPLKLYLATEINLHGISGFTRFRNHLKVRISPFKSPVLRNSRNCKVSFYFGVQCQEVR